VILPGTPISKKTRLGLDLEGGIELVYEARPTPQVPEVTQQAIDDAIETMRKRLAAWQPELLAFEAAQRGASSTSNT
jgi:SecD/SecF fusion protein